MKVVLIEWRNYLVVYTVSSFLPVLVKNFLLACYHVFMEYRGTFSVSLPMECRPCMLWWFFCRPCHNSSCHQSRVPTPPGKSWIFFFKIPGPEKSSKITLVLESPGKIVATRCHILRLKCTKFDFGWGSAPDPALRELTVFPQIPYLDLKHPTSKKREGEGGQGSEGEGRVFSLYLSICGLQKGPGEFLMGVLESPGFFVSKRVGTLSVGVQCSPFDSHHIDGQFLVA